MARITIPLDDESARRLRELARRRGTSVEQTAQELLLSTLSPTPDPAPHPASHPSLDDPDGSQMFLRMAGSLTWPGVEGIVTTTNVEIDQLLAAEAMNPHEDA